MSEFATRIRAVFVRWTALQLALSQGWGEKGSRLDDLIDEVSEFFEKRGAPTYKDEIEKLLLEIFEEDFGCVLEDGSASAVAALLVRVYEELQRGEDTLYRELAAKAAAAGHQAALHSSVRAKGDDSDGSDDGEWTDSDGDGDSDGDDAGAADACAGHDHAAATTTTGEGGGTAAAADDDGWVTVTAKRGGRKK